MFHSCTLCWLPQELHVSSGLGIQLPLWLCYRCASTQPCPTEYIFRTDLRLVYFVWWSQHHQVNLLLRPGHEDAASVPFCGCFYHCVGAQWHCVWILFLQISSQAEWHMFYPQARGGTACVFFALMKTYLLISVFWIKNNPGVNSRPEMLWLLCIYFCRIYFCHINPMFWIPSCENDIPDLCACLAFYWDTKSSSTVESV